MCAFRYYYVNALEGDVVFLIAGRVWRGASLCPVPGMRIVLRQAARAEEKENERSKDRIYCTAILQHQAKRSLHCGGTADDIGLADCVRCLQG